MPKHKVDEPGKRYCCHICSYSTLNPQLHTRHMIRHDDIRNFPCSECDFRALDKQALRKHVLAVHQRQEGKHTCPFCNEFRTTVPYRLKYHIQKVHQKYRPHECHHCTHRFADRWTLNGHIYSRHGNVRPFQCDECTFRAAEACSVKNHKRRVHDDHNPFKCEACGEGFDGLAKLKYHKMSAHELDDQLIHRCDQCAFTSADRGSLARHIWISHTSGRVSEPRDFATAEDWCRLSSAAADEGDAHACGADCEPRPDLEVARSLSPGDGDGGGGGGGGGGAYSFSAGTAPW